uniref:RING-type domain-containing protein n=1 Tax=viral metagenome TaxID=1070528 RepID=A0A6C0H901_9ZZZZ
MHTNLCLVRHCKYNNTHVTLGHQCGLCKSYGHGRCECRSLVAKNNLKEQPQYNNILPVELQCKFGNCEYKIFHTTEGHQCKTCNKLLHSTNTCLYKNYNLQCPICKIQQSININNQRVYDSENVCVICMDNKVELIMKCKHLVFCIDCFKKYNGEIISSDIKKENILINEKYDISNIKILFKSTPSYIKFQYDENNITLIRRLNITSQIEGLTNINEIDNNFIDGYEEITTINNPRLYRLI